MRGRFRARATWSSVPAAFATVVLSVATSLAAEAGTDASAAAMSFELAFRHKVLSDPAHSAISADGKYVAYVVQERPDARLAESGTANGTPAVVVGSRVVVTETATRRHRTVAPNGGNCWQPAISPEGSRIALYCDSDGVLQLWMHELQAGATKRLSDVRVNARSDSDGAPQWSPEGDEVFVPLRSDDATVPTLGSVASATSMVSVLRAGAELRDEPVMREDAATPRTHGSLLAAVDARTGTVRVIVPADSTPVPRSLRPSPSGKWIAYVSDARRPDMRQSRSASSRTYENDLTIVRAEDGSSQGCTVTFSAAEGYGYIWHPTRDQLFWVRERRLWTLDLSDGFAQPQPLVPALDSAAAPIAVTRDGETLLVGTYPNEPDSFPRGSLTLAAVSLGSGAVTELRLPAGHGLRQIITQRGATLWQPLPEAISVVTYEFATGETAIVRLDLKSGTGTTIWKARAVVEFAGASADHRQLFGAYEDIDTPRDLYRFSKIFADRVRVSDTEPRFAGLHLARAETFQVSIPRHDGSRTTVTSAVLLPPGAKRGDRLPTVAVIRLGSSWIENAARFGGGQINFVPSALFTTRGYAVLLTAAPSHSLGTPSNIPGAAVDALLPQVYEAASLGYTDIARMAVTGHSYGAWNAASIVSESNAFRAAIVLAGVYDLAYTSTAFGPDASYGGRGLSVPVLQRAYGVRGNFWEDQSEYLDRSPYFRADRIRTPMLILHGTADLLPAEDARKMFDALRLLGRTAQYAEYADQGHSIINWSRPAAVDGAQRILSFLDRYVKPRVSATEAVLPTAP